MKLYELFDDYTQAENPIYNPDNYRDIIDINSWIKTIKTTLVDAFEKFGRISPMFIALNRVGVNNYKSEALHFDNSDKLYVKRITQYVKNHNTIGFAIICNAKLKDGSKHIAAQIETKFYSKTIFYSIIGPKEVDPKPKITRMGMFPVSEILGKKIDFRGGQSETTS